MKQIYFLVFFIFNLALAQQNSVPDILDIKKKMELSRYQTYHKNLFNLYKKGNLTELTNEMSSFLYYGFAFNTELYSEFDIIELENNLKQRVTKTDYNAIVISCLELLKKDPFSITTLNILENAYTNLNDTKNKELSKAKKDFIINLVLRTGNGSNLDRPIYVLFNHHQKDVLSVLGFVFNGLRQETFTKNYLMVENNYRNIDGLYFEVTNDFKNIPEEKVIEKIVVVKDSNNDDSNILKAKKLEKLQKTKDSLYHKKIKDDKMYSKNIKEVDSLLEIRKKRIKDLEKLQKQLEMNSGFKRKK